MVAFEIADHAAISQFNDHVHSFTWFKFSNILSGTVYDAITAEISTDRHQGSAHYLFADGHVEAIHSSQIAEWAREPFRFCLPQ